MHRTQIYLQDVQYRMLRTRATRERKSIAAIIREILDTHLGLSNKGTEPDPLDKMIGVGKGDGAAVAENYEEYLYGKRD